MFRWISRTSASCVPTSQTGFSDEVGLCRLGCRWRAELLELADGARELRVLPFERSVDMRSNSRLRNGISERPRTIGRGSTVLYPPEAPPANSRSSVPRTMSGVQMERVHGRAWYPAPEPTMATAGTPSATRAAPSHRAHGHDPCECVDECSPFPDPFVARRDDRPGAVAKLVEWRRRAHELEDESHRHVRRNGHVAGTALAFVQRFV